MSQSLEQSSHLPPWLLYNQHSMTKFHFLIICALKIILSPAQKMCRAVNRCIISNFEPSQCLTIGVMSWRKKYGLWKNRFETRDNIKCVLIRLIATLKTFFAFSKRYELVCFKITRGQLGNDNFIEWGLVLTSVSPFKIDSMIGLKLWFEVSRWFVSVTKQWIKKSHWLILGCP